MIKKTVVAHFDFDVGDFKGSEQLIANIL